MAVGAEKWIWENSRASNGSLIVLLAIARECGEGEFAEMKMADLAAMCRLGDRAVRMAVKDLQALGELSVEGGRGAVHRYSIRATSAISADAHRQNLPGTSAISAGPAESADVAHRQNLPTSTGEPQVSGTSAKSADVQFSNVLSTSTGSPLAEVKEEPAKPPRPRLSDGREDVDRLCAHLANRIEDNGSNRPRISGKWRDAARLMIDADNRTEEQVHTAIDWCQDNEFWRSNILSMPKLRERYEQLRMQAKRDRSPSSSAQANSSLDVVSRYMERVGNGGN